MFAIVFFSYDLYAKFKNKNSINVIIDDMKGNLSSSNKVGLEYKIKFILYVLLSIYSLCYAILSYFDEDESVFEKFKIFSESEN